MISFSSSQAFASYNEGVRYDEEKQKDYDRSSIINIGRPNHKSNNIQ